MLAGRGESRHLTELLEDLALLAARVRAGEPISYPRVILHLTSGRDVPGLLVAFASQAGHQVALLADPDGHDQVVHVVVDRLEALTVFETSRLEQPVQSVANPSRFEVRRALAALESSLLAVNLSLTLGTVSDDNFEPVISALPALQVALLAIAASDLGSVALRAVQAVRVSVGEQASAVRAGDVIDIVVASSFLHRPDARSGQDQLERVL